MKTKKFKINVPQQDLQAFSFESLVIDPFWYDLYGIENEQINKFFSNAAEF